MLFWVPGAVKPFQTSAEPFRFCTATPLHIKHIMAWKRTRHKLHSSKWNQLLRTGTSREEWKGQNKARTFPWRDQLCRRQFLLYWKQEKKVKVMRVPPSQLPAQFRALFQKCLKFLLFFFFKAVKHFKFLSYISYEGSSVVKLCSYVEK